MPTTTNLSTLKINYLTQAQYNAAVSNNTINENEIYLTPSSIADHSYTPAGSVSVTPTVTVNTTTVNSITAVGELPSLSMTVTNEILSFTWAAGSLPTKGNDTTVATGIDTATATASFTGTAATLSHTVS